MSKSSKAPVVTAVLAAIWLAGAAQAVTVVVPPPDFRFAPSNELILDTDLKLAAGEFELSQELRPLLSAGDYPAALVLIEARTEPGSAALLLLRAQLRAIAGRYDAAIADYRDVLRRHPDTRRAHAGLGTLYLVADRLEEARDSLAKAVSLGAGDAETLTQLAFLNARLKQPWSAIAAYQQALVLKPDDERLKRGLLDVLIRSGNLTSARALADELIATNPDNVEAWQQSANMALRSGDKLAAVTALEVSLRLGDDTAENVSATAQLHLDLGNYSRAGELLRNVVDRGVLGMNETYPLVDWLIRVSALEDAERLLNAAGRRVDGLPAGEASLYFTARGSLAETRGQIAEAARLFGRAVAEDPANGGALIRLATVQLERGQLARAQISFERAETLPDVRRSALLGRAQVAIERGEYATALQLLQRVQADYSNGFALDGQVQSLKQLVAAQAAEAG